METKRSQVEPFDMICNLARRGGISGKIGDFVAQKTIPAAANCAAPGNPRQQVRRYVKTPRPNSLRQQWIAHVLRESWIFNNARFRPRWPEVVDAGIRVGFYWNVVVVNEDGSETNSRFKAGQRGGLIQSFIREMTGEIARTERLPPFFSDIRTPRLLFDENFTGYLNTLNRIPYGYSPRD